jgi:tRNA pseudouridine38-40 synthase
MRNLKLTVEYDGTEFHGWQAQARLRTVAGVLAGELRELVGHEVTLAGASRTDRGVHALGQVVSFQTTSVIPAERFKLALNGRLPGDIRVRQVEPVGGEFHARFNAVGKHYRYLLHRRQGGSVFLSRYALTWSSPLELSAMQEAARSLIGKHDFASFQSKSSGAPEVTVRTLDTIQLAEEDCFLRIDFWGGGFLYKMVRALAGTLLEVGRRRWAAGQVKEALEARDRRRAGPTAPPHGLCLVAVYYNDEAYRHSMRVEWPIFPLLSGHLPLPGAAAGGGPD